MDTIVLCCLFSKLDLMLLFKTMALLTWNRYRKNFWISCFCKNIMFWIFCKKASNIYIRQELFSRQRIKILIHVYRCSCLTHDELNILHCCFCDSLIIRLHNLRSGDSTTLEVEIYNLWIYSSTLEVENPQPWKWKSTIFEVEVYFTTLEVETPQFWKWRELCYIGYWWLKCFAFI